ncbi:tRNA pseudouridine(38-40) synthase TruA [Flavobacterium sp.]|jgi:tRNA pseudouridine38-40 synthase|uniref:tRNA pseudouridine(38-40) synthase TruA n=1 Tax=Flavobacterium sp. TaxID=239 RepID=UPI0037BF4EA6
MRYFLEFAYKGTNYHGWQYQPNATSVQETLNKALSTIFKKEIDLVGAGRTDAGVHAKQMFAHFDLDVEIEVPYYIHKLNSFLPKDIAVLNIYPVQEEAHARFDATKRTYEYHIHTTKDAFESNDSWYYPNSLNIELMNEACKILFNYIDFECFSKVHTDVNTFNCKIYEAHWQQIENRLVFTIAADRFLRNMVRAIVGTMVNIGLEKVSLQEFSTIIEGKDRNKAGFSVPAHGLYLTKVEYPFLEKSIKI